MITVGENVRLKRNLLTAQSQSKFQRVFHRNGIVLGGVPEEGRRRIRTDTRFPRIRSVGGVILRAEKLLERTEVRFALLTCNHRITENQHVRTRGDGIAFVA